MNIVKTCLALAASLLLTAQTGHAQNTIKVGVIAPFSGPFADYGKQMEGGIKAYMAEHGDTVAGKKIEIISKDTTGPAPEVAKRLAQELVVRDKVDFLAGFGLTLVPAGGQGIAFMKGYRERGLAEAGIRVIATGDLTDDHVLPARGDATLGVITTFHYSAAHDSPQNKAFLKSYASANPNGGRANFMSVAAYDGMHAIYEVVRKLNGNIDGDKAMAVLKTIKFTSPRGPIAIDPQTRDIVQTVYVRKVEKVGGELFNVEFDRFADRKDTGK
jgi:ABC-type branched-subunit amino acid transport system substrate-binding protein